MIVAVTDKLSYNSWRYPNADVAMIWYKPVIFARAVLVILLQLLNINSALPLRLVEDQKCVYDYSLQLDIHTGDKSTEQQNFRMICQVCSSYSLDLFLYTIAC